jgi:hypothetical protein
MGDFLGMYENLRSVDSDERRRQLQHQIKEPSMVTFDLRDEKERVRYAEKWYLWFAQNVLEPPMGEIR